MVRLIKKVSKKIGVMPGKVVYVGDERTERVKTNIIERDDVSVEACFSFKDTPSVTWINVNGIHDVDIIEQIGKHFDLHQLVLEDIANTGQRPKIEVSKDHIFLVVKMLYNRPSDSELVSEQVSIIFGSNFVISFQEQEGDVFELIRERIRTTTPRVKLLGTDYLAYSLIDAIVDNYFLVLEDIGDKIEPLEDKLIDDPKPGDLQEIYDLKRKLIDMRKRVWPLREVIGNFERLEVPLIHDYTGAYLRDLYEHVIQVIDTVETARDMVSGLLDIYLSSVSNRMNEIMKVLTIIATIFIPLSFIAGIYGMNFNTRSPFNLPELEWRFGYLFFWGVALAIGIGMFLFFKRKRWL
jgi:magnesium transporter